MVFIPVFFHPVAVCKPSNPVSQSRIPSPSHSGSYVAGYDFMHNAHSDVCSSTFFRRIVDTHAKRYAFDMHRSQTRHVLYPEKNTLWDDSN